MREEAFNGRVNALGRIISGIALARDEAGKDVMDRKAGVSDLSMDVLEDLINELVPMATAVPALDDAGVIAMEDDMWVLRSGASDGKDEEFKPDGFSPSNVSFSIPSLPAWDEPPGSPSGADR